MTLLIDILGDAEASMALGAEASQPTSASHKAGAEIGIPLICFVILHTCLNRDLYLFSGTYGVPR